MPRIITALLLLLPFLPQFASAADDGPRPVAAWLAQLQTLGAKHRKGETDAQNVAATKALKEAIAKEHDGKAIQFTVEVKDVKWKDGVAAVTTSAEYTANAKPSPAAPLTYFRHVPFEVRMTEAEAVAIKKGTPLRFTGVLTFHPGKYGAVGLATQSQQLYQINHSFLGGLPVGTFTSSDCSFQIGGRQYESRWKKEEKKD